jgi:hypothetical protein
MVNFANLVGNKAVDFIQDNIDKNIDYEGNAFQPYSFGYWLSKYKKRYAGRKMVKGKQSKAFATYMNSAKSEWAGDKKVNLTKTGAMRASLSVIEYKESAKTIVIGFVDQESAQKAYWHNVSGAGKGKVLRKFMGLRPAQEQDLADYAGEQLSKDTVFIAGLFKQLGFEF